MLDFLYTAISWVLLQWYHLLTLLGMSKTSGVTWALSIILLTFTARAAMFRLFVKQIHYQRNMQAVQPKIKAIRDKYKDDRAAQQREMMKLQQEEGFNPIAGCLPMLLQLPIWWSLFHVLRHLANSVNLKSGDSKLTLYGFKDSETLAAAHAKLFHAPLSGSLLESVQNSDKITSLGGTVSATVLVCTILAVISASATLLTQLISINGQPTPAEGQAAMIQKLMLYGIPIMVLASGTYFPLGLLLYWFASNVWTMGQQAYIYKFHPHPDLVKGEQPVDEPNQLGRSLAPKVGAKPINPKFVKKNVGTSGFPGDSAEDESTDDGAAEADSASEVGSPDKPSPGGKPAPGAKPDRGRKPGASAESTDEPDAGAAQPSPDSKPGGGEGPRRGGNSSKNGNRRAPKRKRR